MRRLGPVFVAALGLLATAGCDSCSRRSAPDLDASRVDEEVRIEVLAPGSEPRSRLAIGRWTGLRYRWTMTSSGSFGVQGQKPITVPKVQAKMSFEVVRGSADPVRREHRGRTVELVEELAVVDSIEVLPGEIDPAALAAMNEGLADAVGTTTRLFTAEDGELVDMSTELLGGIEPGPDEKELLDRSWEQQKRFPFRFPPTAVGIGGKWRFSETVRYNGIRAIQLSNMEIVKRTPDRIHVRIKVRQHASRQEIPHPFMEGENAIMEQYRADGDGLVEVDPITGLPLRSKLSLTARITFIVPQHQGLDLRKTWIAASVLQATAEIVSGDAGVRPAPSAAEPAPSNSAAPAPGSSAPPPEPAHARP